MPTNAKAHCVQWANCHTVTLKICPKPQSWYSATKYLHRTISLQRHHLFFNPSNCPNVGWHHVWRFGALTQAQLCSSHIVGCTMLADPVKNKLCCEQCAFYVPRQWRRLLIFLQQCLDTLCKSRCVIKVMSRCLAGKFFAHPQQFVERQNICNRIIGDIVCRTMTPPLQFMSAQHQGIAAQTCHKRGNGSLRNDHVTSLFNRLQPAFLQLLCRRQSLNININIGHQIIWRA